MFLLWKRALIRLAHGGGFVWNGMNVGCEDDAADGTAYDVVLNVIGGFFSLHFLMYIFW